jgi:hypothetical protein
VRPTRIAAGRSIGSHPPTRKQPPAHTTTATNIARCRVGIIGALPRPRRRCNHLATAKSPQFVDSAVECPATGVEGCSPSMWASVSRCRG